MIFYKFIKLAQALATFASMLHKIIALNATLLIALFASGQNQAPVISNLAATADTANKKVAITFDLSDTENDAVEISVGFSDDGGESFLASFTSATGDVGFPVSPGSGKQIELSYDPGIFFIGNYQIRIVADDRIVPSIADIVAGVDSVRLRSDLAFIASASRHYQGNPSHLEAVKDTIEARFLAKNLQTYRQPFTLENYSAHNIIGRMPGMKNEAVTYLVDAHFDSVEDAPGADDNGSGVAGMLEAMRVLSQYQFEHSIKFIGFDFEESTPVLGLNGSREYVSNGIKNYEQLEGVLNFEMIGYYSSAPNSQQVPFGFDFLFPNQYSMVASDSFRGNFVVNAANTASSGLMSVYDSLAALYVPGLKVVSIALPGNGLIAPDFRRSDHASFWDGGYKAVMLTDGANFRNHNYHTPADTLGALNFTFMSNIVKATVASAAELAKPQHSSAATAQISGPVNVQELNDACALQVAAGGNGKFIFLSTACETTTPSTLRLFNAEGKLATTFSIEPGVNKIRLPVNLSPGVYVAVLRGKQQRVAKRFVVID